MSENCIFCKIVAGQIPSTKVYEDDEFYAFKDIHPAAPIHILLITKMHIETLSDCTTAAHQAMLGRMMTLAPKIAADNGAPALPEGGHRVVMNVGPAGGQEVYHMHLHILAGPRPWKGMSI